MSELKKILKKNFKKLTVLLCLLIFPLNISTAYATAEGPVNDVNTISETVTDPVSDSSTSTVELSNTISEEQTKNEIPAIENPTSTQEDSTAVENKTSTQAEMPADDNSNLDSTNNLIDNVVPEIANMPLLAPLAKDPLKDSTTPTEITVTLDDNYVDASKTFKGIKDAAKVNQNFSITFNGPSNYTLTKNTSGWEQTYDSDGNVVWTWKNIEIEGGNYDFSESNADYPGATYTTSILLNGTPYNGTDQLTIEPGTFTITQNEYATTCYKLDWGVSLEGDTNNIFAASITKNRGCVVISAVKLSPKEEAAISQMILSFNGPWAAPVTFFTIDENHPITIEDQTISYTSNPAEIHLSDESLWQHLTSLSYSRTAAKNGTIDISNDYLTEIVISKKVSGNMSDKEDSFEFTYSDGGMFNGTFNLKDGENYTIKDVPLGKTITIVETKYDNYIPNVNFSKIEKIDGEVIYSTVEKKESNTAELGVPDDITIINDPMRADFNNIYDITLPTGINDNSGLYLVLLISSVVLLLRYVIKKRGIING